MPDVPAHLLLPLEQFGDRFEELHAAGRASVALSRVAVVGLARNCAGRLRQNLARWKDTAGWFRNWRLHIETNDNTDDTEQVLREFCEHDERASYASRTLGREQYSTEFAGRRTQHLAEYRTACQQWVRNLDDRPDYVLVIDWDQRGGWSYAGLMAGFAELQSTPAAYGMASVSLLHWRERATQQLSWVHYDAWALRLNSTFDDYTAGMGGWKHWWLPPVGSPAVPVASAFGGLAIYETRAYLRGTYDGSDCEHVPFHHSAARATGQSLYLCPSMRTVMEWADADDQHG